VVYDPVDLAFMLHEYREWGIEVTAELISFNDYLLSLIECGKIKVTEVIEANSNIAPLYRGNED
jgi:hypothetical protein